MKRVPVARLVGLFGVRGELKLRPTPAGEDAIAGGRSFTLGDGSDAQRVTLAGVRRHHERLLVTIAGVASADDAAKLVGRDLFAERDEIALAPGEYLDDDLVGLRLVDPSGAALGTVVGVEHYPASDCLVVGETRALVPLIKAFVRGIDLANGTIAVELPDGLL